MYNEIGTGGSAVLHGRILIVLSDNEQQQFLASYDEQTGEELWRTNRDIKDPKAPRRSGWTTPFLWTHPLRTEIVTVGPGTTISYDLKGKELWRLNAMSYLTVPSPFAL